MGLHMTSEDLARYVATEDGSKKPDPSWDTVLREFLRLAGVEWP